MMTKFSATVVSKRTLMSITYAAIGAGICNFCLDYFGNVNLTAAADRGWKVAVGLWVALVIAAFIHPRFKGLARPPIDYAVSCAIAFAVVSFAGDTLLDASALGPSSLVRGAILGLLCGLLFGWWGMKYEFEDQTSGDDINAHGSSFSESKPRESQNLGTSSEPADE